MNKLTGVIDGFLYDANFDESLIALRRKTKTLCGQFNATTPDKGRVRLELINTIISECGKSTIIGALNGIG